jgi:hypothetical protein
MSEEREQGSFGWLKDRRRSVGGTPGSGEEVVGGVPGVEGAPPKRRRRRQKTGKRSNPDYEQASAYVRKRVRRRVTQALVAQENRVDYSQLVEALLVRWLEEVGYQLDDEDEDGVR